PRNARPGAFRRQNGSGLFLLHRGVRGGETSPARPAVPGPGQVAAGQRTGSWRKSGRRGAGEKALTLEAEGDQGLVQVLSSSLSFGFISLGRRVLVACHGGEVLGSTAGKRGVRFASGTRSRGPELAGACAAVGGKGWLPRFVSVPARMRFVEQGNEFCRRK